MAATKTVDFQQTKQFIPPQSARKTDSTMKKRVIDIRNYVRF